MTKSSVTVLTRIFRILKILSKQDRQYQSLIFHALVSILDLTAANMPTYYSKRTTAQLALVNLQATTTTDPKVQLGSNGTDVANNATEFARGSMNGTLKELPVSKKDTHSNMSYLGFDENMPFFMVHAGVDLYDQSRDKTHTRKPERVPETARTKSFMSHPVPPHVSRRTPLENANDHLLDPRTESQG